MPSLATFYPILRFLVFRLSTRSETVFMAREDVGRGLRPPRLSVHFCSSFILFVGLDRLAGH